MLEINKGVRIPNAVRPLPPVRRKYPFEQMEVDDMFFLPHRTKNTLTTYVSTTGRRLKMKFETRLCHMKQTKRGWEICAAEAPTAVQGIGVWRRR